MSRMFGERIQQFVLSIDIMDDETFHDLLDLIQWYVQVALKIAYFSVLDEATVDNKTGLRTLWSTRDQRPSFTVDKDRGYVSHSAYTFGENKPLWVVSESRKPLNDADDFVDMWSRSADLPTYSARNVTEVYTSVMHPLLRDGRPIGVAEFAAERYVEPTPASLEEATSLASIISRAYQMYDVRRAQRANTKKVLLMLREALDEERWRRLALPKVFVAYPGLERLTEGTRDGHQKVIQVIRKVVKKFSDVIEPVFWQDMTEAGSITAQVIEEISDSEIGICYLSEPVEGNEYQDNANVLYEAGMMQALVNSGGASLRGWVPIRERASPDVPFDIAAERILPVPRAEDGSLDADEFAKGLKARLEALVKELNDL